MAYHVRVSDEVSEQFSKACKTLGFKQKSIIEGYMLEIIRRAEQVEALKNIDGILGVVFDVYDHEGKKEIGVMYSEKKD